MDFGIRVFPSRTKWTPDDARAFVGTPPLPFMRPVDPGIPVEISVTFSWDLKRAKWLVAAWGRHYENVTIGGPALGDPGSEFEPGRFLKEGVTITSRGCPRMCKWCVVPKREGPIHELAIKPGHIVQDNNLLACSESHIRAVFDMLGQQSKGAVFAGGLDARLFQPWHRKLLDEISVGELWFACDDGNTDNLDRIAPMLEGIAEKKRRCYVMIGFKDEPIAVAEQRLKEVYGYGFLPFCQLYRGPGERLYTHQWKELARNWSRPAIYRSAEFQYPWRTRCRR